MKTFTTKQRLGFYAMILIAGFVLVGVRNYVLARGDENTGNIQDNTIVNLVNAERVNMGLRKLEKNKTLDVVAQKKLQDMSLNDYFAHTSPEGENPWKWFDEVGYEFAYAGENLALDYKDVYQQHKDWMQSPKHRKNILNEKFTQTGVAIGQVEKDGKNVIAVVEVFATPQKGILKSTNFTPDTFEVPEPLLYSGDNFQDVMQNAYKSNKELFEEDSNVREIAWGVVIVITLAVIFVEYRIFVKRKRKDN